jgi:hypothetical protein
MFGSNKLNVATYNSANDSTFDSNEEPIQFKPYQPRLMTPVCHVTSSSSRDDSLAIHTSTIQDNTETHMNYKTLTIRYLRHRINNKGISNIVNVYPLLYVTP